MNTPTPEYTMQLVEFVLSSAFPVRSKGSVVTFDSGEHGCDKHLPHVYIMFNPAYIVTPGELADALDPSPISDEIGWCITVINPQGTYIVHP
jgi:hypothetical protein